MGASNRILETFPADVRLALAQLYPYEAFEPAALAVRLYFCDGEVPAATDVGQIWIELSVINGYRLNSRKEGERKACAASSWIRMLMQGGMRGDLHAPLEDALETNCLALVPSVDSKIAIHGHHGPLRKTFAEADEAQVCQIGRAVGIALRQPF